MWKKIIPSVAFVLGLLAWTTCLQSASADVYTVSADVSIGVHAGNDKTFTLGDLCTITDGGAGSATYTNYMLVRFDFSGWPSDPGVTSVKLRLTRSGGDIPTSYVVYARGFYPANNTWYLDPENVTGNHQHNDDITWKKSDGSSGTIEEAGYNYLGGSNTWDGDTLEISLSATKVQNWITGATPNNGLRLFEDNATTSPYFYGSGAANVADRPTLIIEATAPEPASLVLLTAGAVGLLFKRRRQCQQ